jgi:hypothetical protein
MRELGKELANCWAGILEPHQSGDMKDFNPWPPPCSLRTRFIQEGVVLWTIVRWTRPARRQEHQDGCVGSWDGHVFGKDLQHQIIEESPLGKYRFRKEFNCIRKDLIIPVILGVVRGLSIPYIRMTCIYFWIKP